MMTSSDKLWVAERLMVKRAVGFKGLNFLRTTMPNFTSRFATSALRAPPSLAGSVAARGRALVQDGKALPWSSVGLDEAHNKVMGMAEAMATNPRAGGFAIPGSATVAVNPNAPRGFGGMSRREIIAHEAFHARNPVLGQSETLARFYGGYKGVPARGFEDALGPVWAQRMGAGLGSVRAYLPQRPLYGWLRRSQYPNASMGPAPSAQAGSNGMLRRALKPAQEFFDAYGDGGNVWQAASSVLRPPRTVSNLFNR